MPYYYPPSTHQTHDPSPIAPSCHKEAITQQRTTFPGHTHLLLQPVKGTCLVLSHGPRAEEVSVNSSLLSLGQEDADEEAD